MGRHAEPALPRFCSKHGHRSEWDTGIGKWQEGEFVQAIKTGKHLGVGRPIMPPMPWPAYRNLSDQQLRAIYRYLQSLPPIKNKAPDYVPPSK